MAEQQVIEGTWEEVQHHAEALKLNGRQVKLIVTDTPNPAAVLEQPATQIPQDRLAAFEAWVSMPRPTVKPLLDDSRAVIYGDEEDRG